MTINVLGAKFLYQLPNEATVSLTDLIYTVTGYTSPSSPGTSAYATLQAVANLLLANIVLNYPGNPNSHVAGTQYQLLWDTLDSQLWVATTTGTALTTVWDLVSANTAFNWNHVTLNSQTMAPENGYIIDSAGLCTLTLPAVSILGQEIKIVGRKGSNGWTIAQLGGQQIVLGVNSTTVGVGGSLSSTQVTDSIYLVCTAPNTEWTCMGGPEGNLNYI